MAFFNAGEPTAAQAKPNPRHLPASGGRESTMNQPIFLVNLDLPNHSLINLDLS